MPSNRLRTQVHLTFDIEVWCDGWDDLDGKFPAAFDRYIYGRSRAGEYALPKTLEILQRHGLKGVFFVEPLFSARFGSEWLDRIVRLITSAGQDVQLHIHPEWTDEIRPALIGNVSLKRQHLVHYDLHEQTALIGAAKAMLERSKGSAVEVFRSGSYAANRDTYRALRAIGIRLDSSLNACYDYTQGSVPELGGGRSSFEVEGVTVVPVTVFDDGFGRRRPLQINAMSTAETRQVLSRAREAGLPEVVIVSHNFEMLKPESSSPDWFVVRRFESLCAHLRDAPEQFDVCTFRDVDATSASASAGAVPKAGRLATLQRLAEQAARRIA